MPAKLKHALILIASVCLTGGAVVLDLRARTRHAYLEGEKYMSWTEAPGIKTEFFNKLYEGKLKKLDGALSEGTLTPEGFEKAKSRLEAEKAFRLKESSAKYAYIWYKTAARDFTPPENKWSRLAEAKMPAARRLWKKELTDAKIKFEDYMLD